MNDKVYIGQTIRTIEARFLQHIRDSKRHQNNNRIKLYNAINKYGSECFHIDIIEECGQEKLNEREKFWIEKYDSYKNGYNATLGGFGRQQDNSEEILAYWEHGLIVQDIVKQTGHAQETIKNTLLNNGVTLEEIKTRAHDSQSKKVKVPIYQYDLDGNYVDEFDSIMDAEKETGIHHSCINGVLCGVHYSAGFYQWRRYKTDNIGKCPHKFCGTPKTVYQYTEDGKYICSYPSIAQASKAVGLKSTLPIRRVCRGISHTSKGFRWSYELMDELPPMQRRINQYA